MAPLSDIWKSEPADYTIDYGGVHVWRCELQASHLSNGGFVGSLSTKEIERARRFVRESDRDRYIFAHALLRSILGTYLGCSPQELVFGTNQYGKPFLVSPNGNNEIQFNLSHSRNMALIVVARQIAVGIDVEYVRTIPDAQQIVERFFSGSERQFLSSLSPVDFIEAFFGCWTLKEAFTKGIGMGLSHPLDELGVTFADGKPVGLTYGYDTGGDSHCWKIIRLSPGPGYSGAVAIEAPGSEPVLFEYRKH